MPRGDVIIRYFIEVCSGERSFEKKLGNEKYLKAPKSRRHITMLSQIQENDKVLHYLTTSLTKAKDRKSTFVGESTVSSKMKSKEKRISCELKDTIQFPAPVKLSSLKDKIISPKLERAIKMSMQSYIFEIEEKDYLLIKSMGGDKERGQPGK